MSAFPSVFAVVDEWKLCNCGVLNELVWTLECVIRVKKDVLLYGFLYIFLCFTNVMESQLTKVFRNERWREKEERKKSSCLVLVREEFMIRETLSEFDLSFHSSSTSVLFWFQTQLLCQHWSVGLQLLLFYCLQMELLAASNSSLLTSGDLLKEQ